MKKYTFNLFLLFSLFFSITVNAQKPYNLNQFVDESIDFVKQPAKWDAGDWGKFGIITASTFLLTQIDQPIHDKMLENQSYFHSAPVEFGRMWGEIYPTVLIGGSFGIYGILSKDNTSQRIGFEIFQTAFYAGSITTILKASIGRARPFTNKGSSFFKSFSLFNDDYHSLPSGHATMAFALSTVLSKNAKSDYLKILAYVPAVLTAFSRVYQNKHWVSDVFLGAAVGYFTGSWVHDQHDQNDNSISITSSSEAINLCISF